MKSKSEQKLKKLMNVLRKVEKKENIIRLPIKEKVILGVGFTISIIFLIILILASVGTVVYATGLVDDTINSANEYSKYALSNYQLDFYVDNSWNWLPWNWSDGIGKSVMYGLYAITNFIWIISLYLSNATGYLVQEAYSLDFVSQTVDFVGKNIQTIAGISRNGFSHSGFYVGFLLILLLFLGIYVSYVGLLKRETTKAVRAVLNFFVVFIISASFIAYAPDYIGKINDFSKDVSNASLDVGTKIVLPDTSSQGKESVDMIRDSLFSIQVKQPWLLLQFGSTDVDNIGNERVENLLSTSPDTNNGKDREGIVVDEIEKQNNKNLTITNTISRIGTVFFLFIFNIGISIFVFMLTGIMIFSQVLFIIFSMFLPVSFLLSMIPSFEGMSKRAITKLFNVIMTRAGITLIITVAFSISTMLYRLSTSSPFFMIMFLQLVTFAGIYFKLGDLMSMFALQGSDSQSMGRQMLRRPRMFMSNQSRRFQRRISQLVSKSPIKKQTKDITAKNSKANHKRINETDSDDSTKNNIRMNQQMKKSAMEQRTLGKKFGEKVGYVMDSKNFMSDKAKTLKDQMKSTPTNVKYALYKGKGNIVQNASDFTQSVFDTRKQKHKDRMHRRNQKQARIAEKRLEMDRAKRSNHNTEFVYSKRQRAQIRKNHNQPVPTTNVTKSTRSQLKPLTTIEQPDRTQSIIRDNQQTNHGLTIPTTVKKESYENKDTNPDRVIKKIKDKENQHARKQAIKKTTATKGHKK